MDVSIVIVNYNTSTLVENCVNSVLENTKDLKYEIIIVDNNSPDGTFPLLKEKLKDKAIFVQNNENIGFGLANNEGFKIAKGKYLFCLNPDTLLVNNSVKILFDFMENNPDCGAAGGNLYDKNMNFVHSFGYGDDIKSLLLRKTFFKYLCFFEYLKIKRYESNIDRSLTQEVNHITGADLMLRKSVIDKVGGFSEKFFMYFEETELEVRIKRAGYKVFFVPDSKIIHLEGKSVNKNKTKFFDNGFVEYYKLCYGSAWGEIAKFLRK